MELVHRAGSLSRSGRESVDACRSGLEYRLDELTTAINGISWAVRLKGWVFPGCEMIQEDRGTCNYHEVQRMTRHVLNCPFEVMWRHTLLETRINLDLFLRHHLPDRSKFDPGSLNDFLFL